MFNPANNLVAADGTIDVSALMRAAHIRAKREMADYRASRHCTEESAKYWTYARHFKETIQWAWDRAKTMQRLALKVAA